jgi:hypothetical protein
MPTDNTDYKWYSDFLSRKFIVLAIATCLLWFGKITDDVWLYISLAFIGTNIVQKYIEGRQYTSHKEEVITRTELSTRRNSNVGVAPGEEP